jgi:fructokinase
MQDLLDRDSLNTLTEMQLEKALSFANKVASITVTRKGANPPWLHQIK